MTPPQPEAPQADVPLAPLQTQWSWGDAATTDGTKYVLLRLSDPAGVRVVWFNVEALRALGQQALHHANRVEAGSLTIARDLPKPGPNGDGPLTG